MSEKRMSKEEFLKFNRRWEDYLEHHQNCVASIEEGPFPLAQELGRFDGELGRLYQRYVDIANDYRRIQLEISKHCAKKLERK